MKDGVKEILGKEVTGVVMGGRTSYGTEQLFLVFHDGSYLEIYGRDFTCSASLSYGGINAAVDYAKGAGASNPTVCELKPKPRFKMHPKR